MSWLCSEIGRGHPFYLDGLIHAVRAAGRDDLLARRADVFSVSRGLAHAAWHAVRATYQLAGRGGLVAGAYRRARDRVRYDEPSPLLRLLGRDLRRWAGRAGIVVVDHPLLVGALGTRRGVWYMHGEAVAPPESIVGTAARILVPSEKTAEVFVRGGVARPRLTITGVCVEPGLVPTAEVARRRRRARVTGSAPLTVAVFSSGAEPTAHVEALRGAAVALAEAGHLVWVFARRGGRLERAVTERAVASPRPVVIPFEGRPQLDRDTADRFERIDLMIGPPHERSNWALALGLPLLMVGPDVGTFAPLNRAHLVSAGVARALEFRGQAAGVPAQVAELRHSGRLARMIDAGTGVGYNGFDRAAAALIEAAGPEPHDPPA